MIRGVQYLVIMPNPINYMQVNGLVLLYRHYFHRNKTELKHRLRQPSHANLHVCTYWHAQACSANTQPLSYEFAFAACILCMHMHVCPHICNSKRCIRNFATRGSELHNTVIPALVTCFYVSFENGFSFRHVLKKRWL